VFDEGSSKFLKIIELPASPENEAHLRNGLDTVCQCLLPFGPEPTVFSSAVKKLKNQNIQDDNFACGSVWT
jgi:hypothetical protein